MKKLGEDNYIAEDLMIKDLDLLYKDNKITKEEYIFKIKDIQKNKYNDAFYKAREDINKKNAPKINKDDKLITYKKIKKNESINSSGLTDYPIYNRDDTSLTGSDPISDPTYDPFFDNYAYDLFPNEYDLDSTYKKEKRKMQRGQKKLEPFINKDKDSIKPVNKKPLRKFHL